jgi:hypothetical protein
MTAKKKSKVPVKTAISRLIKEYGIEQVKEQLDLQTRFVIFKDFNGSERIGKILKFDGNFVIIKTIDEEFKLHILDNKPIHDFCDPIMSLKSENSSLYLNGKNNSIELSIIDKDGHPVSFDIIKPDMQLFTRMLEMCSKFYYTE